MIPWETPQGRGLTSPSLSTLSPTCIQQVLNKCSLRPFSVGCSFILQCRDESKHSSGSPAVLRGCCPEEGEAVGSPHACRIPAACPGLGPALAASSPPGHGRWQPPPAGPVGPSAPMSGRSQCSRIDALLRWCGAPILISPLTPHSSQLGQLNCLLSAPNMAPSAGRPDPL